MFERHTTTVYGGEPYLKLKTTVPLPPQVLFVIFNDTAKSKTD